MSKIPDIGEHARKVNGPEDTYYVDTWQCKHCKKKYVVRYSDFANLRRHLREHHRMFYHPFVIHEEVEWNTHTMKLEMT